MTPEAKAREIAVRNCPTQSELPFSAMGKAVWTEGLKDEIARALRDVERETLERAAKEAERQAEFRGESDGEIWIANKIAQSIRSLLQKEGG